MNVFVLILFTVIIWLVGHYEAILSLSGFLESNSSEPVFCIQYVKIITITMLNLDKSCFENTVDPGQPASEKPADQDSHCFPLCLQVYAHDRNPES